MTEPHTAEPTAPQFVEIDQPFVSGTATPAQAVNAFGHQWVSRLHDMAGVEQGIAELYKDTRVHWLLERPELGLEPGRTTILDLGTLEGAHAIGLAEGGARVVGLEAHTTAWLRALVLSEVRGEREGVVRPKLVLGEATSYLKEAARREQAADMVFASGLLYHLTDPFDFIAACRAVSPLLFVWTHYFDEAWFLERAPEMLDRFGPPITAPGPAGAELTGRRHGYLDRDASNSFYGGSDDHSLWLTKDGLEAALVAAGYPVIEECFLNLDHPNGPSIGYIAHDPDGEVGDTDALWDRPWHDGAAVPPAPEFRVLAGVPAPPPAQPELPDWVVRAEKAKGLAERVVNRVKREVDARRA